MIFYLSEGMENCKISGKSMGIFKWMISGNPDFPKCSLMNLSLKSAIKELSIDQSAFRNICTFRGFYFNTDGGWSGGAKVLGKLPVPRRPTYLD